jgi:hypothetical protein
MINIVECPIWLQPNPFLLKVFVFHSIWLNVTFDQRVKNVILVKLDNLKNYDFL